MVSRRQALIGLALGLFAASSACAKPRAAADGDAPKPPLGELDPLGPEPTYRDNVDALFDILIPTERDAEGNVTSPGAREAQVDDVLTIDRFAALTSALGLLPIVLPDGAMRSREALGGAARAALNADLDALAAFEKPLTPFRELPRPSREAITARAFEDDNALRPIMLVVRAACFVAWLGAVTNDAGLTAVGFPPFEDFDDGLAIRGYPTRAGDDYTFNEEPPGPAEDLSLVLDANGDLL